MHAASLAIIRKLLKVHQKSLPARGQKKKNFNQLFKHSLACISRAGRLISPRSRDVSLDDTKTGMRTGGVGRKRKETVSSVPMSKQNQPTRASYFIIIVSITRFSFLLKIKGLIQPWTC